MSTIKRSKKDRSKICITAQIYTYNKTNLLVFISYSYSIKEFSIRIDAFLFKAILNIYIF